MEKKQIVFIHGGEAFSSYDAFLNYLRTDEISDPLGLIPRKRWQQTLREVLGETYEVYMPSMPNKQNAKYLEWKIWFERHFPFLRDGVILVGHSQGGYFLAKYLSENTMPVSIRALYLLGAPFEKREDALDEDGGDFAFDPKNLANLTSQVEDVHIFHSEDDFVVPYEHALKYKEALSQAELHTFTDKNHFILEEFPELIAHIRAQ
jgi:uncharacterized protein